MLIEKKIKYQALIIMMLIISTFGLFFLYEVNYYVDNKVQDTLTYKKSFEIKLFNETLKHHRMMYTRRIDKILSRKFVVDAFATQDREALLQSTIGAFTQFKKENPYIKIFTFRLPDGSAFLRVHKPEMFGDSLNTKRKIIIDANHDQSRKVGFEIGKLKMTYRIVTPIFKDKVYLGLVELGVEPEGFIKIVNKIIPLKYALVVHNSMQDIMLGKTPTISNHAYVLATKNQFFQNILNKVSINDRTIIEIKDNKFAVDTNMILKDHNEKVQAFFLTIQNITSDINKASSLKRNLFIFIILSMIFLWVVLNYYLNYYIKNIKTMLFSDELTGLASRNALVEELRETSNSSRLFLIDINSFKNINEIYGVYSGNDILKQMGEEVNKIALLHTMQAFRISSDEFVLFSRVSQRESEKDLLQEIYTTLTNKNFILKDLNILLDIDISIGAAYGDSVSLEKVDMALKNARKKHLHYMIYSPDIDTKKDTKKTLKVKEDIRNAIENNNIIPFFQPIVNADGVVIKYEALMRMAKLDNGKQKIMPPSYFLDLSFKFNLYPQLSKIIISKSFKAIENTNRLISINLAPSDLIDISMNKYILNYLKNSKNPEQIIIEITENEDITDFEIIKKFIYEIKKTGAKIAIDDFGTGYANYTHIFELKPDYIKIDGTLIKDIITNKDNQAFVKTIITLAKELNVKTIAEYVHSKEVFELVKSYGVDEFQGFYFGQAESKMIK